MQERGCTLTTIVRPLRCSFSPCGESFAAKRNLTLRQHPPVDRRLRTGRANQQPASRPRHQPVRNHALPETRWVTWYECTIADWLGHGGRTAPPPTGMFSVPFRPAPTSWLLKVPWTRQAGKRPAAKRASTACTSFLVYHFRYHDR